MMHHSEETEAQRDARWEERCRKDPSLRELEKVVDQLEREIQRLHRGR